MSAPDTSPTVVEVMRFETCRSARAGHTGQAPLAAPTKGDLIGKTREQLRSLHFRRDRDWLLS